MSINLDKPLDEKYDDLRARLAAAEARGKELHDAVEEYRAILTAIREHTGWIAYPDIAPAVAAMKAELKAAREVVEAAKDLRCKEDGEGDKLWDALDRYDALKGGTSGDGA